MVKSQGLGIPKIGPMMRWQSLALQFDKCPAPMVFTHPKAQGKPYHETRHL
jgi:hypothetical protein